MKTINVVLYAPEIPQNTGNIMRTCAGLNIKLHLIKPLGFSLDEKAVARSAANYLEHVDYQIYDNYDDFLKQNEGDFFFITRYGKKPPSDINYSSLGDHLYFIFGSESSGLPKEIMQDKIDNCLRLPMNDKIRSLNLSNTVAIVAYEVLRQLGYQGLSLVEPFKGENFLEEC